jgi:hypothetical protein
MLIADLRYYIDRFSTWKFDIFPVLQIDVIRVLRQQMLVVLAIDSAHAVRHNIRSVRLISLMISP